MPNSFTRGLLPAGTPVPGSIAAERWQLPYEDPFDFDEKTAQAILSAEQETAHLVRDVNRERAFASRQRRAAAEARAVSRGVAFSNRAGQPVAMVSPLMEDDLLPPRPEVSTEGLLPIFEPMHNAREIAKQLVLLEDHLAQPAKHCPDCIRKHLLTAEALAEEAVTLDKTGQYRDYFVSATQQIRNICRGYIANQNRGQLQQRVRRLRKAMSKSGFDSLYDTAPNLAVRSGSRAVIPQGVQQGALVAYKHNGKWMPGRVLEAGSRYRLPDGSMDTLERNPDGDRVVIATAAPNGYGENMQVSGTFILRARGDSFGGLIIPLHRARISNSLRGKSIQRFKPNGQPQPPEQLNNDQLFMADLIQAVMHDTIGGNLCRVIDVRNVQQLDSYGCRESAALQAARAAVITAWYESNLDPTKTNLSGRDRSYGLFQQNRMGGMGVGHSVENLLDPVYNTVIFAKEFKRILNPSFGTLIRREAAAQPTKAGDWTRIATIKIQRPAQVTREAEARATTANLLFPSRPAQQIAAVSIIRSGMNLNTDLFAQEFPDIWSFVEADEARIRPILMKKVPPDQLKPSQVEALNRAAQKWGSIGRGNRMPSALNRAVWLSRYAGDLVLYRELLEFYAAMAPNTVEGAEAQQLLDGLLATVPASEHASTESAVVKAVKVGAIVGFGAIAVYALREAWRTY